MWCLSCKALHTGPKAVISECNRGHIKVLELMLVKGPKPGSMHFIISYTRISVREIEEPLIGSSKRRRVSLPHLFLFIEVHTLFI